MPLLCTPSIVVENAITSPTFKVPPSVTVIVVSPTAVDESLSVVAPSSSYAVALGQVDTNKLLPHAPPLLAANVPTAP